MNIKEAQQKEDEEMVIIVDEKNKEIGKATRQEMRAKRLIHRSTFIYLFQKNTDQLFCHFRSAIKRYCPSYYDASFGGVVAVGESYESCASRELKEECGLANYELIPVKEFYFENQYNRVWGKIFYTYFDGQPVNLIPQPEEIDFIELMSLEEIDNRALTGDQFTPDGLLGLKVLKEHLKK